MKKVISASLFLILISASPLFVSAQWIDNPYKGYTKTVTASLGDDTVVYTMPNDFFYHKENCPLLVGGKTGLAASLARKKGLKPCPKCLEEKTISVPSVPGYDWGFSVLQPTPSKNTVYSDNFIDVFFIIEKTRINFSAQNKTDSGIKINWDDLSFVSPTGRASRVIHSGVKLIDKNNAQAPTTIPPKSKITDIIIPAENIEFTNGKWQEGEFFEGNPLSFNGKEFSVYFPVEIRGAKKEYSFKFNIIVTKISAEDKK